MARHNREGRGIDQHGELWHISYQPDWLKHVKISRRLPNGRRRSTLTLFRNPARRAEAEPGKMVRTRIAAADGSVDIELSLEDRTDLVDRIAVRLRRPRRGRKDDVIRFVVQGGLPGPD